MRYRQVHCLIWNDDKFPFLSDDAQLVFFHILTTPFSNSIGCFKISLEALTAEKRWPIRRYKNAFKELENKKLARYDEKNQVIFLPNFIKYNPPANPKVIINWARQWSELPDSPLKYELYQLLKDIIKTKGEKFSKAFEEAFGKGMAYPMAKGMGYGMGYGMAKGMRIQEQEQYQEQDGYGASKNIINNNINSRDGNNDKVHNIVNAQSDKNHSEPSPDNSSDDDIFITIPLVHKKEDGTPDEFLVTRSMVEEFHELYPGIDVEQELRNIRGWNLSHPERRKTRKGILRHITGWLSKAQDGARARYPPSEDFESGIRAFVEKQKAIQGGKEHES